MTINCDQSADHYREARRDRLMAEADAEYDRLTVTPAERVTPIMADDIRDVSIEQVKAFIRNFGVRLAIFQYGTSAVDEALEN